jgi:hypothetical protein
MNIKMFVSYQPTEMLEQWHTVVEQLHNDDMGGNVTSLDGMYTGASYSITGTATPVNMMSSATLMGPINDYNTSGGYGTLRSSGGQMFDALSDKVIIGCAKTDPTFK